MPDISHRQKIHKAREYYKKGELVKAKTTLKGVDHAIAVALLTQIEQDLAQTSPPRPFPILPVVGLLVGILMAGLIAVAVIANAKQPIDIPVTTTTPEATPDCTPDEVQMWWQTQALVLESFRVDAASASLTMPGQRLSIGIQALQAMRDRLLPLPPCAEKAVQQAVADLLPAMDDTLALLERWSNGELDGLQLSNEFFAVEKRLREARADMVQAMP